MLKTKKIKTVEQFDFSDFFAGKRSEQFQIFVCICIFICWNFKLKINSVGLMDR